VRVGRKPFGCDRRPLSLGRETGRHWGSGRTVDRLGCRRPVLALLDVNNTDGRVKVQTEQTQPLGLRAGDHALLLISRRVHATRARDDVTYDCWRAFRVISRVINLRRGVPELGTLGLWRVNSTRQHVQVSRSRDPVLFSFLEDLTRP